MIENTVQIAGIVHSKDHGGVPTPWQGFSLNYQSTYYDMYLQPRVWCSNVKVFAQGKELRERVQDLKVGDNVLIHGELIYRHALTRSAGAKPYRDSLDTVIRLKQIVPLKGALG